MGHKIVLFLVFKGISILVSTVAASIYIPTNRAKRFPFLHTLRFIVCRIFDDGHADQCEVIPHHSGFFFFSRLCWVFNAALGFCPVVASRYFSLAAVQGLPIAVDSFIVERRL